MTSSWAHITSLGDISVLLPIAVIIALWLAVPTRSRPLAWRWSCCFTAVCALVVVSKMVFLVWGFGIASLDFAGFSGHSALAALVWPALAYLVVSGERSIVRATMLLLGSSLAAVIAVSRLVLHAHSMTEVLAGGLLGTCAVAIWLLWAGKWWAPGARKSWLIAPVLATLFLSFGHNFPSERLLRFAAERLDSTHVIYVRNRVKALPQ